MHIKLYNAAATTKAIFAADMVKKTQENDVKDVILSFVDNVIITDGEIVSEMARLPTYTAIVVPTAETVDRKLITTVLHMAYRHERDTIIEHNHRYAHISPEKANRLYENMDDYKEFESDIFKKLSPQ